jgi:hypothetical protein
LRGRREVIFPMSSLLAQSSLREFFREVLGEVMTERRVEIAQVTEFYLVNLLSEFVQTEKLFPHEEEGRREHEPLAVLYHRALTQGRDERIRTLRRLGDVSLYKAGFFADALRDGMVGPDYYIQMGGAAYGQVAAMTSGDFADAYRELGGKFRTLAEVLEEIAARGLASGGASGALKVYESWVRTGSDRLERVLVDMGLLEKSGLPN